jgi:hypothetical protein
MTREATGRTAISLPQPPTSSELLMSKPQATDIVYLFNIDDLLGDHIFKNIYFSMIKF